MKPRSKWQEMAGAYEERPDIFLSLISEDGNIMYANSNMLETFHLENPETAATNFLDLLHPFNLSDFKSAIRNSSQQDDPPSMELYLKNGYYHPMKWEVNYLAEETEAGRNYLCVGQKILDDVRIEKFNQLGEQNYQLIVEGMNAGVLFQDRKGELIAANKKAADIFSATLERLYQLTDIAHLWNTAWEIKTEQCEAVPFDKTPFMRALQTGLPQTEVLLVRLGNGEKRWLRFSCQPLLDDRSTTPYAVVSNITDVTQEKQLSRQLEEREALFSVFMKQTPNLAWVVDEEGTLVFGSESFYSYFRLDPLTAAGNQLVELIPSMLNTDLYQKHLQVLASGKPGQILKQLEFADGNQYIFHVNIFPIEGVTSKKMLGGHAVDISEKYKAEKQLKETNDRLLMLTRATSDAIWEWDMQTGKIFRNDALMDMIGYQPEAPKGLSWWFRRIHPEDRNRVSDKVRDITEKGLQSWADEYRFKCADGEYIPMRDRGFVVYENGLPIKMIGSLQDISGMKELEEQLIEEKVTRQKEVSETVIRVQEKERTKIGHELHDNVNQILSTCKLFVDMLTPADNNQQQFKQKSIDYIMLAIEEIRKLSKELVVPQLGDDGLVENIYHIVEDLELSTDIKIKFTHDHDNDLLSSDKKITIFRILQEQLKNILKHSQATHIDIFLQVKDKEAQLVLRDNGVGFDPRKTHRGIGLANIFERTRFYNGTVDVQTSPGKGCMIDVRIPVE